MLGTLPSRTERPTSSATSRGGRQRRTWTHPRDPESVVLLVRFRLESAAIDDDIRQGRSAADYRRAAFALAARAAALAAPRLEGLIARPFPIRQKDQEDFLEECRRVAGVLGAVTSLLYFGSGAMSYRGTRLEGEPRLDGRRRQRFWRECQPVLQALRLPRGCENDLHDLVRFLGSYADDHPKEVLQWLLRFLEDDSGRAYITDIQGGPLVAELCQHYLCVHPTVVATDDRHSSLLTLLNLLVESGWPSGVRLAARLHEVWR